MDPAFRAHVITTTQCANKVATSRSDDGGVAVLPKKRLQPSVKVVMHKFSMVEQNRGSLLLESQQGLTTTVAATVAAFLTGTQLAPCMGVESERLFSTASIMSTEES